MKHGMGLPCAGTTAVAPPGGPQPQLISRAHTDASQTAFSKHWSINQDGV